ncbi:MAG: twin-arginine translocase subunit TatC [Candidatus Omnitrophica bacterium]|nr:twin-arginine translocase subunit TatC [Candidatus Omnitrophota bacterium]
MTGGMSLLEHLEELRRRIILCLIIVILATVAAYLVSGRLIAFLLRPIGNVVFTSPDEAFLAYINVSLFAGLVMSCPFILYHIWRFAAGGLRVVEKSYVFIFGPLSLVLFAVGALFGYFVIVPIGIRFLLSFAGASITPMISIGKYLAFTCSLTLAFGITFELPLAILFLTKLGLVTPRFLAKKRRYAILVIFIVSAILTPPDVMSQFLMAGPLVVLYELSILLSRFVYRAPADAPYGR